MSISGIFDAVITNARNGNPNQFYLPTEYLASTNLNLASTEKDPDDFIYDTDGNDLMKLPPRKCYYCKKICSDGEIISCDFCPGHFHISCLSPPLCCIPDVKWMCPLHPHHILSKIINGSYSITELSVWWNKIAVCTDNNEVEADFIRRTNSLRDKQSHQFVKVEANCSVQVPDIIKYHYEYPSPKTLGLRELNDRSNCVLQNSFLTIPHELILKTNICCSREEEKSSRIPGVKKKIEDVESHYSRDTKNATAEDYCSRNGALIEIVNEDYDSQIIEYSNSAENSLLSEMENRRFKFTSCGIYDYQYPGFQFTKKCDNLPKITVTCNSSSANAEEMDDVNPNILLLNKIRRIIDCDIRNGFTKGKLYDGIEHLNTGTLKEHVKKSAYHFVTRRYPPSFLRSTLPYPFFYSSISENIPLSIKPRKEVHAVLCPLSHHGPPVYMYSNVLNAGTDICNDVCLFNYGHCDFLSRRHAIIFHDQYTNTYELLNTSEYSVGVDGLHYANDLSAKTTRNTSTGASSSNEKDENYEDDDNQKVFTSTQTTGIIKDRKKRHFSTSPGFNNDKSGVLLTSSTGTGIAARDRESRYAHKKLLQDIEKLTTKSPKEMASIADEDLNEISQILRIKKLHWTPSTTSSVTDVDRAEECKKNSRTLFIIKRRRKPFPNRTGTKRIIGEKLVRNSRNKNGTIRMEDEGVAAVRGLLEGRTKASERVYESQRSKVRKRCEQSGCRRIATIGRPKTGVNDRDDVVKRLRISERFDSARKSINAVSPCSGQYSYNYDETNLLKQQEKCKCRMLNLPFLVGHDSSWEVSAPLRHGSHIRFGCMEFVFCIVKNRTTFKEWPYVNKIASGSLLECDDHPRIHRRDGDGKTTRQMKNDDLSGKLTSILSVLSSESRMRDDSFFSTSHSSPLTTERFTNENKIFFGSQSKSKDEVS